MEKKLLERFTKKDCKTQIKQSLDSKKKSRETVINCMSNGKAMIISLIVGFLKLKISLYKVSYFPEP